jgi:L-lactate dehydrogenase complex protein LldG
MANANGPGGEPEQDSERNVMARLRGIAAASAHADAREALDRIPPVNDSMRAAAQPPEISERFLARAQKNGFSTERVHNRSEVVRAVSAYVSGRQSQRRFVAGHDARLAALPWRNEGLLPRFGCASADDLISVSYARCGLAETGSVCLWVDRDNPASNNLLCDAQLIIVDRGDLLERLDEIWDEGVWHGSGKSGPGRGKTPPRGVMMISGPSSTADIAMQLVYGAHGPRAVHLLLLDPEGVSGLGAE